MVQTRASSRAASTVTGGPPATAAPSAPALQVSAHQSGSLITTERFRRWPVRLWPAEIGAPRRSRTYIPLAGSRVISSALSSVSALVSGGVPGLRSSLMLGQSASDSNVSVDQSGRSITCTREIDDVILDAVRLAGPGDGRRPARLPDTASLRDCARVSGNSDHPHLGRTRQAAQVLLACHGASRPRARCHSGTAAKSLSLGRRATSAWPASVASVVRVAASAWAPGRPRWTRACPADLESWMR
jgi:hypothetical protein